MNTHHWNRREALRLAGLSLTAAISAPGENRDPKLIVKKTKDLFHGLKIGLASYSTRKLSVDDTIACCRRVGVHYISLKDVHLKLTSTPDERAALRKKFQDSGVEIESCGVIYLKDNAEEIRRAFEYVTDLGAGVAVIGCHAQIVPTVEKVIRDFDLLAAIHNHGPEDKLGAYSPLDVWEWVKDRDKKLGLCMDVGHTFRCGVDPIAVANKCASRLYNIHNKDLAEATSKARGVPVGQGVIDVAGLLKTLVKIKYARQVALEYEVDADNPLPGIAESIGFERGVLSAI